MDTMPLVLFLLALPVISNGANILMFHPLPVKSHMTFLNPLAQALAGRNHSVTIYTCDPNFDAGENIKIVHLSKNKAFTWKSVEFRPSDGIMAEYHKAQWYAYNELDFLLGTREIQDLILSDDTYDALIASTTFFLHAIAAFQHRFTCLGIEYQLHRHNAAAASLTGSPYNAAYFRSPGSQSLGSEMTFTERLSNIIESTFITLYANFVSVPSHQKLIDRHLIYPGHENRPPLSQLLMNKSLILVNGHHLLSTQAPVSPLEKDVAGLAIQPLQPLKGRFEKFLENAEYGFIVMSWGSLLDINDKEPEDTVLRVFSRLKQRIIWKHSLASGTCEDGIPENVLLADWIPQTDLLGDSRCLLFITHGGINSLVEAVHSAVPVVVTPFALDQPRNAMRAVEHGIGVLISPENFTATSFAWAIDEVLNESKYKEAVNRLSNTFHDRILPPLSEAVFWIEYVLEHGTILQPKSKNLSIFVLWHLDMVFLGLVIVLGSVIVFGLVVKAAGLSFRLAMYYCVNKIKQS